MIVYPHAKINLGLRILRRRPDGYHDIETLLYPVGWSDILEILPSPGSRDIRIRTSGLSLPGRSSDNLVYRAASLMQERFGLTGMRIHLHKQVPAGAGLGGGSSDAAFTLMALRELFSLSLPPRELHRMATQLGSDCAFFLEDTPALATGRGDKLTPVSLDLQGTYLMIIFPGIVSATARMYRMIQPADEGISLKEAIEKPRSEWMKYLINRFEEPLVRDFPVIGTVIKLLVAHGAWYASVTGSGSAVYGLFDTPPGKIPLSPGWLSWTEQL